MISPSSENVMKPIVGAAAFGSRTPLDAVEHESVSPRFVVTKYLKERRISGWGIFREQRGRTRIAQSLQARGRFQSEDFAKAFSECLRLPNGTHLLSILRELYKAPLSELHCVL